MAGKKKLLSMFLCTLFVIFFGITLENSSMASDIWIEDYQLNETIMSAILDKLDLTSYYSDPGELTSLTENFNTMMRTVRARGDYHQVTLADCFFYRYSYSLNVAFNRWRDGFIDSNDATFETYDFYIPLNFNDNSSNATTLREYLNWSYDNNNNINGVIVNTSNQPRWVFSNSNNTYSFQTNIVTNNIQAGIIDIDASGDVIRDISTWSGLFLDNGSNDFHSVQIWSRTTTGGYGLYLWGRYLYLENYNYGDITPTPTSTPTGGSVGTDLSTTNGLITNVINSLNDTPSGDDFTLPSSGDLIDSLNVPDINEDEKVTATNNFWLAITNGLTSAFNDDVRYYHLDFLGIDTVIDNQAFSPPSIVIEVFSFICNLGFVFVEYKLIRKLVNMFSSGIFSQILRAYSRIDISDLF